MVFSGILSCFLLSSSSSSPRASDDAGVLSPKKPSTVKDKSKSKSSGAPIVVSYFPVNSNLSRL
ncbi:hypothetical protein AAG906_038686 [Vitis piasezkii]